MIVKIKGYNYKILHTKVFNYIIIYIYVYFNKEYKNSENK